MSRAARWAFGINAAVAWVSLALQFALSASGAVPFTPASPSAFGWNAAGAAGAPGRVLDFLSYFTIWSNIVVAVVMTMLTLSPTVVTTWRRVLRLDALIMIVVTGLVYAVVLAPLYHPTGWSAVANSGLHQVTPVLTVLVWLVFGPRGWLDLRLVLPSLVIPLVWLVLTLLRGAVISAYPYPFIDVVSLGYGRVAVNVAGVLVVGVVVALVVVGVDRVLSRRSVRGSSEQNDSVRR